MHAIEWLTYNAAISFSPADIHQNYSGLAGTTSSVMSVLNILLITLSRLAAHVLSSR